jgi:hypothetical protein
VAEGQSASRVDPTVVWAPGSKPQRALLSCPIFEVFFGGARGGGKTDGMLGEWAQHSSTYGVHAIGLMIRRTAKQLGETFERAKVLYTPLGAKFVGSPETGSMRITMPTGARLTFGHLERDSDAEAYQGGSYTRVYIEEAGNFPSSTPILKLFATLRSGSGVPCRIRLTGNPGGPGHQWVKARYIDPAPRGMKVLTDEETGLQRVFIPSKVTDNPMIGANYVSILKSSGNPELVKAWLEGDWSATAGAYFPEFSVAKHIVAPVTLPAHWTRIRAFDWGSARPFCNLWLAVSDGTAGFPTNALIVYREWYGSTGEPNVGLRLPAEAVGAGILAREDKGERIVVSVCDPAMMKEDGGPSMAERMRGIPWYGADNSRVSGWDQVRSRLIGIDGKPALYIFSTCTNLIRTLPALQHDTHKPEDLDSDGEDHCFAAGTLVRTPSGLVPIEELPATGVVCTPDGDREYRSSGLIKKGAETVRLTFSDGSQVVCTPDHKFLVDTGEWIRALDFINDYRYHAISVNEVPQWSRSSAIQFKSSVASVITSAASTFRGTVRGCIASYGRLSTALSRVAHTSITETWMWPTTLLTTSLALVKTTICRSMGSFALVNLPHPLQSTLARRHQNGTPQMRVESGTRSTTNGTAKAPYTKGPRWSALGALLNSKALGEAASVPTRASLLTAVSRGLMTKREIAMSAGTISARIDTVGRKPALQTADLKPLVCLAVEFLKPQDVYCLTVPDVGCFLLGNGLIVSNCADTLRYGCMSRPWKAPPPRLAPATDSYDRAFRRSMRDDDGDSWRVA